MTKVCSSAPEKNFFLLYKCVNVTFCTMANFILKKDAVSVTTVCNSMTLLNEKGVICS